MHLPGFEPRLQGHQASMLPLYNSAIASIVLKPFESYDKRVGQKGTPLGLKRSKYMLDPIGFNQKGRFIRILALNMSWEA